MPIVIHFADFEDMLPELSEHSPVRITRLMTPVETIAKTPGMSTVEIGVHVRQVINAGATEIVAWMMSVGSRYTIYEEVPIGDPENQKAMDAWAEATEVEQLVKERLVQNNPNVDIRAGIIDLGSSTAFGGYWSLLTMGEKEEETEDEEATPHIGDATAAKEEEEEDDEEELPF